MPFNKYTCSYCFNDYGGFHSCRSEALSVITTYLKAHTLEAADPEELTSLIGNLGYWDNA
jgi:hypothetical protein